MDIVRKIKPLKATFDNLSFAQKTSLLVILLSLFNLIIPHETFAATKPDLQPLVFVLGDHTEFVAQARRRALADYQTRKLQVELKRKELLANKVRNYLNKYNSPLANYSAQLIELKNWKQIVALAAAESSLCRKYPAGKANCWGVGGAALWDFGDDLGQGIQSMDNFLNNYPKRSKIKYSQMSFERMNGLYKQPAADHWVDNNQAVYNDLTALEKTAI
jgi:hypothetical protein